METKMKIIEIVEQVKKMVGAGHSYNMSCLTISMILKNKEHVKSAVLMMKTSKKQGKVREEMEKLLSV